LYSNVLWDNCSEKDSKLSENIPVEAARIITGLKCNSSRSKLYDELGWNILKTRRYIHQLISSLQNHKLLFTTAFV
jgi:hypothetical protein